MTLGCNNNCKIKGRVDDLKKLNKALIESNFSMDEIIPLKDKSDIFEVAIFWGVGTEIELQYSVFDDEEPCEIEICYDTNGPIEQFWRNVSRRYNVSVEYAFYNSDIGFVGNSKYEKGLVKESRYEEDPNSISYKTMVLENNFVLPEKAVAAIISFEDLVKRGNKK